MSVCRQLSNWEQLGDFFVQLLAESIGVLRVELIEQLSNWDFYRVCLSCFFVKYIG